MLRLCTFLATLTSREELSKNFQIEKLVKLLRLSTFLLTTLISRESLILKLCQNKILGQRFDFSNSVP